MPDTPQTLTAHVAAITLDDLRTDPGRLLIGSEVEQLLRIKKNTRTAWSTDGRLPAIRFGRIYRYPAGELLKFIENSQVAS